MKNQDTNNAAFCYSVNLLRMLLNMKLITEEEYDKIIEISAIHYGAEKNYVRTDNSAKKRWMYPNSCGMMCATRKGK